MSGWLETKNGRVLMRIRLTPKASRNAVGGTHADEKGKIWLKAAVTAVPEKGRANEALIELLSKTFKIRKSAIDLVSGETDRHKTFEISDADETSIRKCVQPSAS